VWVERAGAAVLGDGRADLLAAIDRTHSISAAARSVGMSYRHAWMQVQAANEAAGEPLVVAAVGGPKGGGARLTPRGQLTLEIFTKLQDEVRSAAASLLQRAVSPVAAVGHSVHLAAAISLQEVMGQLLTEFALQQPGTQVRAVFGASNELADHVLAGAPCDLFVSADRTDLDRLAEQGKLATGEPRVVATNTLVALGPRGMRRTVKKLSDLATERIKHIVLADPECPLGRHSQACLRQAGYYDVLVKKAVHVDNSRAVLAALSAGRAEAALAFASDAAKATDCETLFAIDDNASALAYWGAVVRGGQREHEAQRLLDFFATPLARRCFRRCGLALAENRPQKS
jgi:molybdate transport system substrate-binding protein